MVLIISESNDISTNLVIEWISFMGFPFYRLNPEDKVQVTNLSLDGFDITINEKDVISYSDIISTWFRRGYINFETDNVMTDKKGFIKHISNHLLKEQKAYSEFIHYLLYKKRHLGTEYDFHINKFIQLDIAKEIGLSTPKSYFINRKDQLVRLMQEGQIVTKSSNYVFDFKHSNDFYLTYTELINNSQLNDLPDSFFLSYCQDNIRKYADIRTFFLNDSCFSMAIMSQKKESTKVDFRKYDYDNPNKTVPFTLPSKLENKVVTFMNKIKLISGSLDFILSDDGKFIFLEVNPIGQFGMVEYPCNYGINKKIAEYLTLS